jgi:hypothetical protein
MEGTMVNAAQRLTDDTILARTLAGQREALVEIHGLDESQRRMLLLVNGFTPLGGLMDRLPQADDLRERMHRLLEEGLVAAVEAAVPRLGALRQ